MTLKGLFRPLRYMLKMIDKSEQVIVIAAMERELPPGEGAVATGFGRAKTKKTLEGVIADRKPSLVISVGLVGAVIPELKVGDIFIPEKIVDYDRPEREYIVQYPIKKSGVLVTVPRVFHQKDKINLKKRIPAAAAVDMETAAVAEVLSSRKIPLLCIKAVSDDLEFDLHNHKLLRAGIDKAIKSYTEYLTRFLHIR